MEHLALESAYLKFHFFNKVNSNLSTKPPAWKCRHFILFISDLRCFFQKEDLCFKTKTHTLHFFKQTWENWVSSVLLRGNINILRQCKQPSFGLSLVINSWFLLLCLTRTPAFERGDQSLEISNICFVPHDFQECLISSSEGTNQCFNALRLSRLFAQFPFAFGVIFIKDDGPFLHCLNTELCFQHLTEMLRLVFMNMTIVTV